jgi:hypothetical protein
MIWPTPEAACVRLPLKGAMPAARLSRFRGILERPLAEQLS